MKKHQKWGYPGSIRGRKKGLRGVMIGQVRFQSAEMVKEAWQSKNEYIQSIKFRSG
jgi:hypothetical protein